MKSTTDTDILGDTTPSATADAPKKGKKADKKAAKADKKASKAEKAEKPDAEAPDAAADTPKLSKEERKQARRDAKKAARVEANKDKPKREPKPKKEKKVDARIQVDQTPTEVTPIVKLTPLSAELLIHLHEKTKGPISLAELGVILKTDTKGIAGRAKSLIDGGLVVKDDKLKTLDVVGTRQDKLTPALKVLSDFKKKNNAMPSSAKFGRIFWGKDKSDVATDAVKFGRAGGKLLSTLFKLGLVRQFTQPRRKYSADKVRKLFAVVE